MLLTEAGMSRRDFMKRSGTAASLASKGYSGLLQLLSKPEAQKYASYLKTWDNLGENQKIAADYFLSTLVNSEWDGQEGNLLNQTGEYAWANIKDGIVTFDGERFPLKSLIGLNFKEVVDRGGSFKDLISMWFTGDNIEVYNKILPGVLDNIVSSAIKKNPREFIGAMSDFYGNPLSAWESVIHSSPEAQRFLGVSPQEFRSAVDDADLKALNKLIDNGIIDKKQARSIIQNNRERNRRRQEYEQKRQEKEKQEPEDIEAPEDYRWASSMHQPFESKLARILGVL
jgi:hypothetical protein